MGRHGARAPRTGSTLGTPTRQYQFSGKSRTLGAIGGAGAALFGGFWILFVIAWWLVKLVAFIIFIVAAVDIVGALVNNNAPTFHDIGWAIGTFIAVWIL